MYLEKAEYAPMAETGRSILRLIQNNRTATLDLLVRECLQNSLDASMNKESESGHHVDVDFICDVFNSSDLANHLLGIEDKLKRLYPGMKKYIAIKDKNTVGLTGPIRATDLTETDTSYGNLLKLVYEISKPQDSEGAGGSWGLGKTVYYRVGIGLVIFYSRIFDEKSKKYESRLAATLIEDETGKKTLLPKTKLGRGIAWWGQKDPLDRSSQKRSIPLSNSRDINNILSIFKIQPYKDNETGTTIIIPYIDEQKLLKETRPHSEDSIQPPYWTRGTVLDYIKMAAQRWYVPRINNKDYLFGSYLKLFFNGKMLTDNDIVPFFRLVRDLYNAGPDEDTEFNGKRILCKSIDVRGIIDVTKYKPVIGWISFVKVDVEDMKMLPPNNLESPYRYINKDPDQAFNNPIIMFTRKPGMIVSYELTGDWVAGIPTSGKDEFIVGLFFANSNAELLKYNCSVEEYLRRGEKADHMSWGDWTHDDYPDYHPNITLRIQKGVRKKLQENYGEINQEQKSKRNIGLGRMLADFLLPPEGFSPWDNGIGGGAGEGGVGGSGGATTGGSGRDRTSSSRMTMQVLSEPEYKLNSIDMKVRFSFGKKTSGVLETLVASEAGMMDSEKWEKQIGSAFPITINSLTITKITRKKTRKQSTVFEGAKYLTTNSMIENISIEFVNSRLHDICTMIRIMVDKPEYYVIEAVINYSLNEKDINGSFSFGEDN